MKVLLAIDDSKYSEAAMQALIVRTEPKKTEVRVLHVVEAYTEEGELYFENWKEFIQRRHERGKALLAQAAQALRNAGFQVTTALEEGDEKSVIIDVAAKWPADLIIMGSHGRKGFEDRKSVV